jgi:phosphohistidine swiveling domain-containing protein
MADAGWSRSSNIEELPDSILQHRSNIMATISHNPEIYEWNDSLTGNFLWSNVNFGEAVTETMTPLTWSVIRFTLGDWIFLPGYPTVGNIGGFPYLNISVFATLFRTVGRNQDALLKYMEATLYMRLPEEMQIPLIPISARSTLSGIRNSMRVQNKQRDGINRLPTYLADNLEWFKQTRSRIDNETYQPALATLWNDEIKHHIKDGVWTALGTATFSSEYTMKLRRRLAALVGEDGASALISNLSDKADPLPSLEPVMGIARVANGELSRAAYLEQFGHRGPHEFELSVPRPVENPQWLDQELANFKASSFDIPALLQKQQDAFKTAWLRLSAKHPRKSKSIRQQISESARRVRLREQARSAYTRDRWLIRLFALRAAELTGIGDDIFFVYLEEILALLMGDRSALQFIPSRRESYREFKSLPSYPSIIRGRFDPFKWASDPQRSSDIFDVQETYSSSKDFIIRGAAGSAGKVDGIVRRLDNASEGAALKPGEILVTSLTDISWTPLFPRLAAIITDVGAPLSHTAIVAREMGIPAVVGCGNATMLLKTGDRVRVDGGRGIVEILTK